MVAEMEGRTCISMTKERDNRGVGGQVLPPPLSRIFFFRRIREEGEQSGYDSLYKVCAGRDLLEA